MGLVPRVFQPLGVYFHPCLEPSVGVYAISTPPPHSLLKMLQSLCPCYEPGRTLVVATGACALYTANTWCTVFDIVERVWHVVEVVWEPMEHWDSNVVPYIVLALA